MSANRLTRDTTHNVIAGVCSGIASRMGVSATFVRVLFVLSCVLPGPQFILYLILWMVLPAEPYPPRL